MSDTSWDFDDDDMYDDEEETMPRQSSGDDLVKKLRKSDRSKEKRIKELESALAEFTKRERESVVKSVLTERGINPKVAAFIPQDIELNADAINAWVNDYSDVFGLQTEGTQENNPNLAALRQIDAATSNAATPALAESLLSKIGSADSMEELMQIIYSE